MSYGTPEVKPTEYVPDAKTGGPQEGASPAPFVVPENYLRGNEKLFEPIKTQDDLYKTFINSQRMIGRGIFLPDDKASPEERAAALDKVFARLGRPEKPDGYELPPLREGQAWDDRVIAEFKHVAHRAGLTKDQVTAVLSFYRDKVLSDLMPDPIQRAREVEAKLVEKWGEAVFQKRVAEASAAARMIGGEAFLQWLDETGLGNEPALIEFLAKVGREMVEDGALDGAVVEGLKTSQDYYAEALDIIQNKENPLYKAYRDRSHPQHKVAVDVVERLLTLSTDKPAVVSV